MKYKFSKWLAENKDWNWNFKSKDWAQEPEPEVAIEPENNEKKSTIYIPKFEKLTVKKTENKFKPQEEWNTAEVWKQMFYKNMSNFSKEEQNAVEYIFDEAISRINKIKYTFINKKQIIEILKKIRSEYDIKPVLNRLFAGFVESQKKIHLKNGFLQGMYINEVKLLLYKNLLKYFGKFPIKKQNAVEYICNEIIKKLNERRSRFIIQEEIIEISNYVSRDYNFILNKLFNYIITY